MKREEYSATETADRLKRILDGAFKAHRPKKKTGPGAKRASTRTAHASAKTARRRT